MFEHNGDENVDDNEEIATQRYLRDFYLKDFSYLSPQVIGVNEKTQIINLFNQDECITFRLFAKKWLIEVLKGLKEFFYGGSLHGVKYIFEPRLSYKEKAIWIIIVVISIAFCAINITQLFDKWQTSPFVNVIDTIPTPIWAVPFPTVVLCPHLHVKLSYANVSQLKNTSKFYASLICPNMAQDEITMPERLTSHQNAELHEFITQASPKCTDIIKSCFWRSVTNSEDCCNKLLKPIFTNYGLCFAFNSFPLNGMKNTTLPWNTSFNKNVTPSALHWGLDIGYPKVFPPDLYMMPLRTMASGETNGLGFDLYLNTSEHQNVCDGNSVGFTLLISSPTDHVYTGTVLRLPMDRMTTVEVTPLTYKTDWSLQSLSPERRKCFFQNERSLEYYEFYTDSNCKHNLLVREAKKVCDCVLFNWPRSFVWEPVCSTAADFECIAEVNAKVEEQLIYAYYANSEEMKPSNGHFGSCHPSCNDILYSSQVFYSDLIKEPGPKSAEIVKPEQSEVTKMNIHFYDDLFLGQHRHAQYDDYYFVGAVGGLLSLFLGFSIISVAELVYFVIFRPVNLAVTYLYHRQRFIGCPCEVHDLLDFIENLSVKVVEQINNSQELVMLNNFVQETNERQFMQSVKDRISDIASWHWVLQDLSKRLEDAAPSLKYEYNAVKTVIERIGEELNEKAMEGRKLGALCPLTDSVEEAILVEFKFLKSQRKKFEHILPEIEKHINLLIDTKMKIEHDVLNKEQTINIEEACAKINPDAVAEVNKETYAQKRKRLTTMNKWVCRCQSLKDNGIFALRRSVILRQIIRGARVELSFKAQCFGTKVDSALRKRLHYNVTQLEEITWQKDEALKDLNSLEEELATAEKSLQNLTDQKQIVIKRIQDRTRRPYGEKTLDVVDSRLRDELHCVKHFTTHLRQNIARIKYLQHQVKEAIIHMDKCAESISRVMEIDQKRIKSRLGDEEEFINNKTSQREEFIVQSAILTGKGTLASIQEVDELEDDDHCAGGDEDDYPCNF